MVTKETLKKYFDNKLETIPNEENSSFNALDEITSLINTPGLVNIDEEDIEKITGSSGRMIAMTVEAHGKERAQIIGRKIISIIPDTFRDKKADNALFNITGSSDLTLYEVNEIAEYVYNAVEPDANIVFGAIIDEKKKDYVSATVILGVN